MQSRGLVCIGLVLGSALALTQPCLAGDFAAKSLRNLLAATATPGSGNISYMNLATTPGEASLSPSGLSFVDEALRNFDIGGGASFFMKGSRSAGGMALSVTRATYPGRGYMLDLRWQLGQ
jgi:hypothetical protein